MPSAGDDTQYPLSGHGKAGLRLLAVDQNGVVVKVRDAVPKTVTANYTLTAADDWATIIVNSASDVIITIPTDAAAGFSVGFIRLGAGNVTLAAATGGTLYPTTVNKLSAQYSQGSIYVTSNPGAAPVVILGGDLA